MTKGAASPHCGQFEFELDLPNVSCIHTPCWSRSPARQSSFIRKGGGIQFSALQQKGTPRDLPVTYHYDSGSDSDYIGPQPCSSN